MILFSPVAAKNFFITAPWEYKMAPWFLILKFQHSKIEKAVNCNGRSK